MFSCGFGLSDPLERLALGVLRINLGWISASWTTLPGDPPATARVWPRDSAAQPLGLLYVLYYVYVCCNVLSTSRYSMKFTSRLLKET